MCYNVINFLDGDCMTTYNTQNPLGSADPRDLYDNAENLDEAVNDLNSETWVDRFGVERITIQGALNRFNDIIISGGQIFESEEAGRDAVQDGQYYYSVSDDPSVSKTLWKRVSSTESELIADDPSAELMYAAMMAASNSGLSGEFPDDSWFSPLYAVADDGGSTLFYVDENGEFKAKPTAEFPEDDQGISYAFIDENGYILLSFDENGALLQSSGGSVSAGREALMPYPYEGTLRASGVGDYHIADLGDYHALSMTPGGPRSVRAVIDRPSIGPTSAVTGFVDGDVLVPDNPNVLHIVVGLGQSLMVGSNADETLVSTSQPYPQDVLMFDIGPRSDVRMGIDTGGSSGPSSLDADIINGFRPLITVANPNRGQTPLESLGTELARYCRESDNVQTRRLFFACGRGGTAYDGLRKGSQPYTDMLNAVTKAKELAESRGWTVIVDCAVLRHGESGDPSPEPTYKDALIQWQIDVQNDMQAITGQMSDVPFLICQPSSFRGSGAVVRYMAEIHAESQYHCVVGPDYPLSDLYSPDFLHGLGGFYFINGEYLARAFRQTAWGSGGKNKIVRMLSATRSGTAVDIQFETPVAPLQFDGAISERNFRGFQYFDGSGEVSIIGAAIIDSGSNGVGVVRLTLSNTPGGSEEVRYACDGQSNPRDLENVPRGQLRDNAGGNSQFDGRPLHNWAIHQSMEVTV